MSDSSEYKKIGFCEHHKIIRENNIYECVICDSRNMLTSWNEYFSNVLNERVKKLEERVKLLEKNLKHEVIMRKDLRDFVFSKLHYYLFDYTNNQESKDGL